MNRPCEESEPRRFFYKGVIEAIPATWEPMKMTVLYIGLDTEPRESTKFEYVAEFLAAVGSIPCPPPISGPQYPGKIAHTFLLQEPYRRSNLLPAMGVERHTLKLDAHESVIRSMRGKSAMDYFSI